MKIYTALKRLADVLVAMRNGGMIILIDNNMDKKYKCVYCELYFDDDPQEIEHIIETGMCIDCYNDWEEEV